MYQNHEKRNALMLLSLGAAAGFLGSKVIPMLASMKAARATKMGADPFEMLMKDHRAILKVLDQMVDAPADSVAKRTKLLFLAKRSLAKHALAEEDVVYPTMHEEAGRAEQSEHLYAEHAEMKRLLFALEQDLMAKRDWSRAARELRDLIQQHIREEEEQVFPHLRQSMEKSRLPLISSGIAREEAMVL